MNRSIQSLRGLAILSVVALHCGHGFVGGTDLFFVLSGFVIASMRVDRSAGFGPYLRKFMARRAWRIMPAAFAWLAIIVALSAVAPNRMQPIDENAASALAAVLQVSNLYWASEGHLLNGSTHFWSLSLEFQFYAVFPFLIWFVPRRILVLLFCGAIAAQALVLRGEFSLLWLTRTDGLMLGVLLAFAPRVDLPRASMALLPAVLIGVLLFDDPSAKAACAALAVVLAVSNDLRCAPIEFIGSRSFSIYLTHVPMLLLFRGDLPMALLATCIASEMTYRFIEQPSRSRSRVLPTRAFGVQRDDLERPVVEGLRGSVSG